MASIGFALTMRLACSKHGANTGIGYVLLNSQEGAEHVAPKILCGGVAPPQTEKEARKHEQDCDGRSGWVPSRSPPVFD